MKKLTIFETSIIGFFVGVVAASVVVFLTSTSGFVGGILSFVSLLPIFSLFSIPAGATLLATFLFVLAVYTIYGLIVGILIKKSNKVSFVVIGLMIFLPTAIFFEQKNNTTTQLISQETNAPITASVIKTVPKASEQYFGQEAVGDLNGDGKDDVAFIVSRPDGTKITLYYLIAAIKTDFGHTGTNLVFLGDKIQPVGISIASSTIVFDYNDLSSPSKLMAASSTATSTSKMYFQVVGGSLKQTTKNSLK